MDNFETIIKQLRQLVEDRHVAGKKAIDDLVASLAGPALPQVAGKAAGKNGSEGHGKDDKTSVEKVLDDIKSAPKTAAEIAANIGLEQSQVRGVLYAKPIRGKKVKSSKVGKKMYYVAAEAADTLKELVKHGS